MIELQSLPPAEARGPYLLLLWLRRALFRTLAPKDLA